MLSAYLRVFKLEIKEEDGREVWDLFPLFRKLNIERKKNEE